MPIFVVYRRLRPYAVVVAVVVVPAARCIVEHLQGELVVHFVKEVQEAAVLQLVGTSNFS
jgi:hypothetical protein